MKKQNYFTPQRLVAAALLAAAYTAISLCLLPMSFGIVQVRIAEALTLLPVFGPIAIWGVTLGCALTNAIGAAMGLNFVLDIFVGTLATLIASVLTYLLRNRRLFGLPLLSALSPVVVNALLVGGELTVLESGWNTSVFVINAVSVGMGELVSCCVLGLLLVAVLEKRQMFRKLFDVAA